MHKCLKKSLVVFCSFFSLCLHIYGQEKVVSTADQQWIHYYATLELSESLSAQADAGYRWKNGFGDRSQYIMRLGASYELGRMFQAAGGIAYSATYVNGPLGKVEFRPYQDLGMRIDMNKLNMLHRFRLEERFINPVLDGRILGSNSFNLRYRYAIVFNIPLFRLSQNRPGSQLVLNFGDEIFLNDGSVNDRKVFDQNRFMISPTVKWNNNFSVGLNWTHAWAATTVDNEYLRTDILWLQIRQRFKLYNEPEAEPE